MARHRKTDAETAVSRAMIAFWKTGFHALGTRELERETGITRFSLQTTYGGKKALFLTALDAYIRMLAEILAPAMNTGDLEGLARWFEARPVPDEMVEMMANGCFLVNSIIEFPRDDAEVNARAEKFFAILRHHFTDTLAGLAKSGHLKPGLVQADLVEVLMAFTTALNVNAKSAAANTNGKAQSNAMAATIRSWAA